MNALDIIRQNSEHFIGEEDLSQRLASGQPLRVKFGVDPTRPDLTFGHMVVLNKLRQFQDLGHQAILIIGDFTTLIGDPSGRSATRPVLTREEIAFNARTYLEQAFRILDRDKTLVRHNSAWFDKMSFEDCLRLARQMTVARMLERDDFAKRYAQGSPISIVEFLYPLVQGRDSIEIQSDIEIGGSDQLFNMLVGRQLLKDSGLPEQAVLTMPLLVGLDGTKKMSKSLDNYIAFNDTATDMFGKLMSIPDALMATYYRLLLLEDEFQIAALMQGHPMQAKKTLACRLTARFHGQAQAEAELQRFEQVFSRKEIPDQMPEFVWATLAPAADSATLPDLLAATALFPSKKEIRRIIEQGGLRLDGEKVTDASLRLSRPAAPQVIQAGKRLFLRLLP